MNSTKLDIGHHAVRHSRRRARPLAAQGSAVSPVSAQQRAALLALNLADRGGLHSAHQHLGSGAGTRMAGPA